MAEYFSKYKGRGGPAIAPGIVQMMGSIGDEYAKGIEGLAEGYGEYRKNKAEKGRAEADFENALSRMDSLYGEEPGDYQQVLNAVDSKTMEKIQKGKGTKEDFLSALNSLNTVGESIEDRREDVESARQFNVTTDQRERQIKATTALGNRRITSGENVAKADRTARATEGDSSRTHSASEGKADRGSREGMHQAGITASTTEGRLNRDSAEKQQNRQITSTEFMFGETQKQEWAKHLNHLDLSREKLDDLWNIHTEDMSENIRQFNDTLRLNKQQYQLQKDVDDRKIESQEAGLQGYGTYIDKTQTTFDPDAHSAAMMGANSLSGPTPAQLQSYMDNPEQFQRQTTPSERAVKALQTPNLPLEVQADIAKMANMDAGTGGTKITLHEPSGQWIMTSSTGVAKMLGSGGKATSEKRLEYDMGRDVLEDENTKTRLLAEYESKKIDALAKHSEDTMEGPGDPGYDKIDATFTRIINMVKGGKESDEDIPEYDIRGKLKN